MEKSYQITYIQEPEYLHAIVTGFNSRDNVASYLEEGHREMIARGVKRILVEERLQGDRLSTFEIFEIVSQGSLRAAGAFEKIAFVDLYAASDLMAFAENVAVNRSIPVMVFSTAEAAREWLLEK